MEVASLLYALYPAGLFFFFFFNDTATTEIYTFPTRRSSDLTAEEETHGYGSLLTVVTHTREGRKIIAGTVFFGQPRIVRRSEEHTSELQSPCNLVCRLLLEKKKKKNNNYELIKSRADVVSAT